jgi:hypothetical protein
MGVGGSNLHQESRMAMTLYDHQQRLDDLEVVLHALVETVSTHPNGRTQLGEVVRRLRARGARGAADLLAGEGAAAAYRR